MGDLLELMAAPFAACAILVGIHAYLGLHVIQRKVIFVDLALAQIAALGATFSFLFGLSPHGRGAYVFALAFAIAGAAIFSLTRMRHERIPQEAIIGIVYAVAMAVAILVADRAPEGAEHIKESLVGAVLWVTWPTILKTAAIYALVGALHVVLRKRFLQISFHPEQAYAEKRRVRLWDFIFYVTFAFVITSSVAIAGVLLVFTFLVIPAVIATLFATRIASRLAIGWAVGIAACLIGMVASYRLDMPSGPTVVASMGVSLLLAGLLYYIVSAEKRTSAILKVAAGIAIVAGILAGLGIFLTSGTFIQIAHEHDWEREHHDIPHSPRGAVWEKIRHDCEGDFDCMAVSMVEHRHWPEHVSDGLASGDASEREAAVEVLARLDDPRRFDLLAESISREEDPLLHLREAWILLEGGDARGPGAMVELLEESYPPLIRDEAHMSLQEHSGQDYGYDPFAGGTENSAALEKWREWASE